MALPTIIVCAGFIYIQTTVIYCAVGIEIGMKEALEKLKEIIGRLRLREGILSYLLVYLCFTGNKYALAL